MSKLFVNLLLFLTSLRSIEAILSDFWSSYYNKTLPSRPLKQNQFQEIILKFRENNMNFQHDLSFIDKEFANYKQKHGGVDDLDVMFVNRLLYLEDKRHILNVSNTELDLADQDYRFEDVIKDDKTLDMLEDAFNQISLAQVSIEPDLIYLKNYLYKMNYGRKKLGRKNFPTDEDKCILTENPDWMSLKDVLDHWIDFLNDEPRKIGLPDEKPGTRIIKMHNRYYCNVDREIAFLKDTKDSYERMLGNLGNLSNNDLDMKNFNEVYDDFIKIKTYISSRNHSDHWRGSISGKQGLDPDHILSQTLDVTEKLIFESGSKFKNRFERLKFIKMMNAQDKTPPNLRLALVKQFMEKHHDFNLGDIEYGKEDLKILEEKYGNFSKYFNPNYTEENDGTKSYTTNSDNPDQIENSKKTENSVKIGTTDVFLIILICLVSCCILYYITSKFCIPKLQKMKKQRGKISNRSTAFVRLESDSSEQDLNLETLQLNSKYFNNWKPVESKEQQPQQHQGGGHHTYTNPMDSNKDVKVVFKKNTNQYQTAFVNYE